LGVGAWIVLVMVIAGMVALFVIVIAVRQTGEPSAIVGSHQHTY
jgi:hypothetical protein